MDIITGFLFAVSVCIRYIVQLSAYWGVKDEYSDVFRFVFICTIAKFVLDELLVATLMEKSEKRPVSIIIALLGLFYSVFELVGIWNSLMHPYSSYWLIDAIGDTGFEVLIRVAFLVFFVVVSFTGNRSQSKYRILAMMPFGVALISIAFRLILNAELYFGLESGYMVLMDTVKAYVIKYSPLLFWGIATIIKERKYERLN